MIFIIKNTQDSAQLIREHSSHEENDDYVSYNVTSLFTNVPIHDTIKYILEENYTHKKLLKLAAQSSYSFSLSLANKLAAAQREVLCQ